MSQHSQGPFKAMFDTEAGWQVLGQNMDIIATIGTDDIESGDPCEEDAKRIAACLNACSMVGTGAIERITQQEGLNGLLSELEMVKAERDELARWKELVSNGSMLQALRDKAERERDQLLEAAQHILAILQHPTKHVNIFDQEKLEEAVAKVTTAGPRYTSVSKGGSYTKLGSIRGAGSLKGLAGIAYQDEKGNLFIREPECFAKRMVPIEKGARRDS